MPSRTSGLIDLHSHTTASDGSYAPRELVALAAELGLEALGITDHDTFDGYNQAVIDAANMGVRLVRGIELNSRFDVGAGKQRNIHMLAYFPASEPAAPFLTWLESQKQERRERNLRLVEVLQTQGVDISLAEVENVGRSLTGRPHFARVLVKKGYARDSEDAFRKYLGESAPTFVERQSFSTEQVIGKMRAAGGIPVVAHPVRINLLHDEAEARVMERLKEAGLLGLEVQHSDQSAELQDYYSGLARKLGLLETGGSDFHGEIKPDIELGSGRNGNIRVPFDYLEKLEAYSLK